MSKFKDEKGQYIEEFKKILVHIADFNSSMKKLGNNKKQLYSQFEQQGLKKKFQEISESLFKLSKNKINKDNLKENKGVDDKLKDLFGEFKVTKEEGDDVQEVKKFLYAATAGAFLFYDECNVIAQNIIPILQKCKTKEQLKDLKTTIEEINQSIPLGDFQFSVNSKFTYQDVILSLPNAQHLIASLKINEEEFIELIKLEKKTDSKKKFNEEPEFQEEQSQPNDKKDLESLKKEYDSYLKQINSSIAAILDTKQGEEINKKSLNACIEGPYKNIKYVHEEIIGLEEKVDLNKDIADLDAVKKLASKYGTMINSIKDLQKFLESLKNKKATDVKSSEQGGENSQISNIQQSEQGGENTSSILQPTTTINNNNSNQVIKLNELNQEESNQLVNELINELQKALAKGKKIDIATVINQSKISEESKKKIIEICNAITKDSLGSWQETTREEYQQYASIAGGAVAGGVGVAAGIGAAISPAGAGAGAAISSGNAVANIFRSTANLFKSHPVSFAVVGGWIAICSFLAYSSYKAKKEKVETNKKNLGVEVKKGLVAQRVAYHQQKIAEQTAAASDGKNPRKSGK